MLYFPCEKSPDSSQRGKVIKCLPRRRITLGQRERVHGLRTSLGDARFRADVLETIRKPSQLPLPLFDTGLKRCRKLLNGVYVALKDEKTCYSRAVSRAFLRVNGKINCRKASIISLEKTQQKPTTNTKRQYLN